MAREDLCTLHITVSMEMAFVTMKAVILKYDLRFETLHIVQVQGKLKVCAEKTMECICLSVQKAINTHPNYSKQCRCHQLKRPLHMFAVMVV